jgi:hypothetical protein
MVVLFANIYKSLKFKKVASKKSAKNGNVIGKMLNTKNIEPTIVKGIDAIPAAMMLRTILYWEIFPIGPITAFSKS